MSESLVPKIADVSSIKGISTLLALPMLCVAYVFQTGAVIGWDQSVWLSISDAALPEILLRRLITIFVLKSLWISFFGAVLYGLIAYIYTNSKYPILEAVSVILIALAMFGIFGRERFQELKQIDSFWSYCLITWGVFLQAMKEQLDEERRKIDERVRAMIEEKKSSRSA